MLAVLVATLALSQVNLVNNPRFETADASKKAPIGYELSGATRWEYNGYQDEIATNGVSLDSAAGSQGAVSQMLSVDQRQGKWVTFRFRAKAEDAFAVKGDALYMKIDFYAGSKYVDTAKRLVYREILNDRKDFAVNGDNHKDGAAAWRTYDFEELLPFPEIDAVKVSVGFEGGAGTDKSYSRFLVDDFFVSLTSRSATGRPEPVASVASGTSLTLNKGLIPLGGRWFYLPDPGEEVSKKLLVTEANANRLFYQDDRLVNPFAGNMTAWLRKGYLDEQGQMVKVDRLVEDNVTITFNGSGSLSVRTLNIPNHTTARFPDTYGTQGYNPSYIQEQAHTYRLPLEPKKNPLAFAMTPNNSNYSLNMGPIGFAVNGVVFYNPFDANMTDASGIMDRCCGHPSPDNRYHYHKYPICVNTPFVDKGEGHSPLIGFAFDGFPVYGPYESKGVLARDLSLNKLDSFNAHYDEVRGWHYHVTPGQFPYLIGGYMGYVERSNLQGPGRRGG